MGMTRVLTRIGGRRLAVVGLITAGLVVAGCTGDNKFAEAANSFIKANNTWQKQVSSSQPPAEIAATIDAAIPKEEAALDDMKSASKDVSGDKKAVASEAITAAEAVLAATKDASAALKAGDNEGVTSAAQAVSSGIDDFNAAVKRWNG